jgi:squalene-hopene/tetraprenyl-beta-curcumene cyclase
MNQAMNDNQDRVVESDTVRKKIRAPIGARYDAVAVPAGAPAHFDADLGHDAREVRRALTGSIAWLVDNQSEEGFWAGRVESNSCIEAEWLLASHLLGVTLPMAAGIVKTLLQRQRCDGAWDIFPDAPDGDINSTVEVYAALRVMGHDPDSAEMTRAREWILSHGGVAGVRVFTRYWLAMIGVWPWRCTPNLPPEIIRLPLWFPINIYDFAQWARATMVPLAVLSARRPVRALPDGSRLEELFPEGYEKFDFDIPAKPGRAFSVEGLFSLIDTLLHQVQSLRVIPSRESAIKLCLEWIVRHQDWDGAWGGIQPPWIYGLLALNTEGYSTDHPIIAKGLAALGEHWSYSEDGSVHLQATESSVWDTLLSLLALTEAGARVTHMPAMRRALEWVLDRQILVDGDWAVRAKGLLPGGWAFQRANVLYPDVDDTAIALLMLSQIKTQCDGPLRARIEQAIERAVSWTFGMQCSNGGWAAFDRDNTKSIISAIPFCNFGEALDPPSVDVTAHVLEALASLGFTAEHTAIKRGLHFIRSEQENDGSWFGRWGVNHIYGIGAVLPALSALDQDMSAAYVRKAADWLVERQNAEGGWGESCTSYVLESAKGRGVTTPSQTAWALLALLAVGSEDYSAAINKGIRHLLGSQTADGTWNEEAYTGAGFPGYGVGARIDLRDDRVFERLQQGPELSRGFMIGYTMYRHYFPMLALARVSHRV